MIINNCPKICFHELLEIGEYSKSNKNNELIKIENLLILFLNFKFELLKSFYFENLLIIFTK